MSKPFMFTGLGLFLITAGSFIASFFASINWTAMMGCVAGYSLMDFFF